MLNSTFPQPKSIPKTCWSNPPKKSNNMIIVVYQLLVIDLCNNRNLCYVTLNVKHLLPMATEPIVKFLWWLYTCIKPVGKKVNQILSLFNLGTIVICIMLYKMRLVTISLYFKSNVLWSANPWHSLDANTSKMTCPGDSAFTELHGPFDYGDLSLPKNSLHPPGCSVLLH